VSDLRFTATEEMITELQKRFDEMIFLGAAQKTQKTEDMTISYSGSYHACVGLVEIARTAMKGGGYADEEDCSD
tara:strand:- start:1377 stop:1598 length:222 start_codon:yes stop_codon:yes gene_type:complete